MKQSKQNKHKHNHTWSFPLFQKSAYIKKIRSISTKNTNQFLIWEKSRSASNKDTYPFLFEQKFKSTSKRDAYLFFD